MTREEAEAYARRMTAVGYAFIQELREANVSTPKVCTISFDTKNGYVSSTLYADTSTVDTIYFEGSELSIKYKDGDLIPIDPEEVIIDDLPWA